MFHKFSAAPAKTRGQKGSGSTRASNKDKTSDADSNSTPNHKVLPTRRQRVAKACVRCRVLRVKCDQLKPCANCVGIKAKCLVTYAPSRSPQPGNNDDDPRTCESSSVIPPCTLAMTLAYSHCMLLQQHQRQPEPICLSRWHGHEPGELVGNRTPTKQ